MDAYVFLVFIPFAIIAFVLWKETRNLKKTPRPKPIKVSESGPRDREENIEFPEESDYPDSEDSDLIEFELDKED
jgi:hypothetical protein